LSEINAAATAWLAAAVALYAAALALSKLLRAAAAIAASVLATSYLLNPRQPWAFAEQVWRAARPALAQLSAIALLVAERLWALLLSIINR